MTFNPCWGCLNNCEYCYARKMAKRFGAIRFIEEWHYMTEHNMDANRFKLQNSLDLIDFKPTFLYSQIGRKLPKKSQRIFVGSMSEIYYWKEFWVEGVIKKIKRYPQHTFQFLTRHPEVYLKYAFPKNCWLGMTVADSKDYNYFEYQKFKISNPDNIKFVSFEPLLYKVGINLQDIDWVIIGAETGNRKDKVIPKKEWIDKIINYCRRANIPIYLKDNLKNIYPKELKEFPEAK